MKDEAKTPQVDSISCPKSSSTLASALPIPHSALPPSIGTRHFQF
jgi:hypothetical protein